MSKVFSLLLAALAFVVTGCTATVPITLSGPILPASGSVPVVTGNPVGLPMTGSADIGVKVMDGHKQVVHNNGVQVRVDRAKDITGYVYETQVDLYASFPVPVKDVTETTFDKNGTAVHTNTYRLYQPGQTNFAITAYSRLEYNSSYTYLVRGTDPVTGDIYEQTGSFTTGAYVPPVVHPPLVTILPGVAEGDAVYSFHKLVEGSQVALTYTVNYRQIGGQPFDLGQFDGRVMTALKTIIATGYESIGEGMGQPVPVASNWDYHIAVSYQSNIDSADPIQSTTSVQLYWPNSHQEDGVPVAIGGDRIHALNVALEAITKRMSSTTTAIDKYLR